MGATRILLVGALIGTGCGPVRSASLIVDANAELAAAETAQAVAFAPFEYVTAEEYLHKAREEDSYADFETAYILAAKARDCARLARLQSEARTRRDLGATGPAAQAQLPADLVCRPGSRPSFAGLGAAVPVAPPPASPAPSAPSAPEPASPPAERPPPAAAPPPARATPTPAPRPATPATRPAPPPAPAKPRRRAGEPLDPDSPPPTPAPAPPPAPTKPAKKKQPAPEKPPPADAPLPEGDG